jgi:hypothetical protein
MAGFTRRYNYIPDAATLGQVPGVVIIDATPAGAVQAGDVGITCVVGETEDGPFATDPTTPLFPWFPPGGPVEILGGKYTDTVGGFGFTVPSSTSPLKSQYPCARRAMGELWNGNTYVQIKGLAFRRLFIARVDTSVGSLTFSPLAFVETSLRAPFALSPGQTVLAAVNGGGALTATFTATAATVTGTGGTFATLGAGQTLTLAFDGGRAVTVYFQAGDTTAALAIARINNAFGSPVATNSAGQITLTSSTVGSSSSVQVVSGTTGTLAILGLTAATTNGTGNVANISAVQAAEVQSVLAAAITGSSIRLPATGKVRICSATGSTGTIQITGGTALAGLGLTVGGSATTASSGTVVSNIPAGTPVNAAGVALTRVVTMQTLVIPAGTTSPVTVRCRPALDDGSFLTQAAGTMTTIEVPISPTAEWAVTNASGLSAALTEAQKDAAYLAAIATTRPLTGALRKIGYTGSARQSPAVRAAIKQNNLDASGSGCFGRKSAIAAPLGSSLATLQTYVATYRDERTFFATGWTKYISEIAALGSVLGGTGFTDSGNIEVHGDLPLLSLCSILPPEENPAQGTTLLPTTYVAVEGALSAWGVDEYTLAQSSGICASAWDEVEGPQYMSGVTSVDPTQTPGRITMQRIKMADYLTDSVAEYQKPYVKKLPTAQRVTALLGGLQAFLQTLKDNQRITDFSVAQGTPIAGFPRLFFIDWAVTITPSMDVIVNKTQISETAITTRRVAG